MTPIETVLSRLPDAKKSGSGWQSRCPAHEDRTPSLSISQGDDGRALVRCHAGCEQSAIVDALGLTMRELMPDGDWQPARSFNGSAPKPKPANNGKPQGGGRKYKTARETLAALESRLGKRSAYWTYHDAEGEPVGLAARWETPEGKTIRPLSRVDGGWIVGAMPEPRPLYNLPKLADAKRIYICEGEKACEAAMALGLVATCSAGGSKAADKSNWGPLKGKDVYILPDNDSAGEAYAADVARFAHQAGAKSIKILRLPGRPEGGGDIADIDITMGEIINLAKQAEPWRPDPPPAPPVETFQPFPVGCLPEPIGRFVREGSAAIGCDPSFLALPVLSALASAIGSTRRLQLKQGWSAPPILWTLIVGESGSQKSPPWRLAMKPLQVRQRIELERHAEDEREHESRLALYQKRQRQYQNDKGGMNDPPEKPTAPEAKRLLVSDTTVEALAPILKANLRGVLLARDELAGWFGSFDKYSSGKGGADAAHWLSMFDAESITVDRKSGTPRTIHVPHAHVSITGGIQPGILHGVLGREHRQNGLAARFLMAAPPRKAKRWSEAEIDPDTEAEYAATIERLLSLEGTVDDDGNARPLMLRFFPDAKDSYVAFYERHAGELADLEGDLAAAWSKLEQLPARLAIVIHEAKGESDPYVTGETMRAAIRLTEWFKHETRRVYGMLAETPEQRERRTLLEWIESQGGEVAVAKTAGKFRKSRFPTNEQAEIALRDLAARGHGVMDVRPAGPKGGRPSDVFRLTNGVTETETL